MNERRIRPHERNGMRYLESMAQTMIVLEPRDILSWLLCHRPELRAQINDITQRYFGPDQRNEWNSWLIMLREKPVLWADGPISGLAMLTPIELESA